MKPQEKDTRSLGELVRLYHVGFRMQPGEAVAISGRKTQMTCRLELTGHHDSRIECGDARCMACIQVLEVLFEVADTLRTVEHETLDGTGSDCTTHGRYASAMGPGHEETFGLDMTIRQPRGAVAGNWAWIFIESVRRALMELGCQNRAPAEPVGCRPPFRIGRRESIQPGATSVDAVDTESRLIA